MLFFSDKIGGCKILNRDLHYEMDTSIVHGVNKNLCVFPPRTP